MTRSKNFSVGPVGLEFPSLCLMFDILIDFISDSYLYLGLFDTYKCDTLLFFPKFSTNYLFLVNYFGIPHFCKFIYIHETKYNEKIRGEFTLVKNICADFILRINFAQHKKRN